MTDDELHTLATQLEDTLKQASAPELAAQILEVIQTNLREHVEGLRAAEDAADPRELLTLTDHAMQLLEEQRARSPSPEHFVPDERLRLAVDELFDTVRAVRLR